MTPCQLTYVALGSPHAPHDGFRVRECASCPSLCYTNWCWCLVCAWCVPGVQIINHPMPLTQRQLSAGGSVGAIFATLIILSAFAFVPASFIVNVVKVGAYAGDGWTWHSAHAVANFLVAIVTGTGGVGKAPTTHFWRVHLCVLAIASSVRLD